MSDDIARANQLVRKATDRAVTAEEARTDAKTACDLATREGLIFVKEAEYKVLLATAEKHRVAKLPWLTLDYRSPRVRGDVVAKRTAKYAK